MKKLTKRVEYVDLLRVIAILSIIAVHVNTLIRNYYFTSNKIYYIIITCLDTLTRAGVPLFFMITGFFVLSSNKREKYSIFIEKMFRKMIIPFIVFSLIYYIEIVIDKGLSFSIIDFFEKFSKNELCYHLWYMYAIIIIYLFLPFEKKLVKNLNKEELIKLMAITYIFGNCLVTINLILNSFNYSFLNWFSLPNIVIYNNYVILGYYLNKYEIKNKKKLYILGIIALMIMPIANYFLTKTNPIVDDSIFTVIHIFSAVYALAVFCFIKEYYDKLKLNKKSKKIILKCSKLSFYMYLIHALIIKIACKIIDQYWIHDRLYENLLFTLLMFSITLILSAIISIISDKLFNFIYKKIDDIKEKK